MERLRNEPVEEEPVEEEHVEDPVVDGPALVDEVSVNPGLEEPMTVDDNPGVDDVMPEDRDMMNDLLPDIGGGEDDLFLNHGDETENATQVFDEDVEEEEIKRDQTTGWSARTHAVLGSLRRAIGNEAGGKVSYEDMAQDVLKRRKEDAKRVAAQTFFEMLVLHSRSYVRLEQKEPYANIEIGAGENFMRDPAALKRTHLAHLSAANEAR